VVGDVKYYSKLKCLNFCEKNTEMLTRTANVLMPRDFAVNNKFEEQQCSGADLMFFENVNWVYSNDCYVKHPYSFRDILYKNMRYGTTEDITGVGGFILFMIYFIGNTIFDGVNTILRT